MLEMERKEAEKLKILAIKAELNATKEDKDKLKLRVDKTNINRKKLEDKV